MHNKRSIMGFAALFGSAVMLIGMSAIASDALTIDDNRAYIETANTAAASISAVSEGAANEGYIEQLGLRMSDGTAISANITEQKIIKIKKAEEKKKAEEEEARKKAEEEAERKRQEEEEAAKLYTAPATNTSWDGGSTLNTFSGVCYGPSGKETFYNLDMSGVVSIMRGMGYSEEAYPYWVREDGCKMLGNYIIIACNLDIRPRGTLVQTSLGTGIVCDTSPVFVGDNATQIDVAVTW